MQSKIIFVGTGSGKASLKRFHSSLYITDTNHNLLVDAGDGISKALLSAGLDANDIDTIVISHFHPDHAGGLASLITQMKLYKRTKPLSVYTTEDLVQTVKFFLYNQYIFMTRNDFTVRFCRYEYNKPVLLNDNMSFLARRNTHLDKYVNDAGMGMISFESTSFLFDIEGNSVFYTGDIGGKDDLYLFEGCKIDIMISESRHSEPEELITAFEKLKAKKLYFTHIPDEYEEKLVKYIKPSTIYLASDGTEISF